jgi:glyoxylase-like metal-dependent hydrolase (beta-lactamase superfamily II)
MMRALAVHPTLGTRVRRIATVAVVAAALWSPAPGQFGADPGAFRVVSVGDGIHLFQPVSYANHSNSVVFERTDGLLVVDAQPSPRAARDLLAAIRRNTAGTIRYLVFTHPHADASGGASAFPADVLRIASRGYRDAVADPEFGYAAESRLRRGYPEEGESVIRPGSTLVLFGRTRLEDSRNPVILLPVAHAHSPGDLLVFQPEEGVLAVGDLAFIDGAPYAADARISGWIDQLNHIMTVAPRRVLALRGAPVEVGQVRTQRNALEWLQKRVDEALADASPEDFEDEETQNETIRGVVLDSPGFDRHFDRRASAEILQGLIDKVIEETREQRRRLGLE